MSRSRKKTPICGHASAASDRIGKKIAWRKVRAVERQAIHYGEDVPHWKKIYDGDWNFPKDGKQWFGSMEKNDLDRWWRAHEPGFWTNYKRRLMRK